ncbi:hypothetical protein N7454_007596 [Penicillium verhagenii]|nr:hypothetical protein N7454_007596 [Penicillium verhagenii]
MASGESTPLKVTPYLIFTVLVATLGPFQFGYHLYWSQYCVLRSSAMYTNEPFTVRSDLLDIHSWWFHWGFAGWTCLDQIWSPNHTSGHNFFFVLGPVTEALASSIPILALGRFVSGVGCGAALVVSPIYVSEVAPPASRGLFGTVTQVMINVGILSSQVLGFFWSHDSMWRLILAAASLVGVLEFVGLFLLPESPVWLADNHQRSQARRVLQRLRGSDADIEAEIAAWGDASPTPTSGEQESLLSPPSDNTVSKQPAVTMLRAVQDPYYRPAILAIVASMLAQQFTGINSIVMYSVSLLQSILPTGAALLTIITSVINLIATLACMPLPDRIGRRTCLLLSISCIGSCSVLLALGFAFQQKIVSAIAFLLFVTSFAMGLGPVPFMLSSELVGPEAVGATQSWGLSVNWMATFVVAQFFPVINDTLGGQGRVYWIFAAMAGVLGVVLYRILPETRGKANADEVWGRVERRED